MGINFGAATLATVALFSAPISASREECAKLKFDIAVHVITMAAMGTDCLATRTASGACNLVRGVQAGLSFFSPLGVLNNAGNLINAVDTFIHGANVADTMLSDNEPTIPGLN